MTSEFDYDSSSNKAVGEGELKRFNNVVEKHAEQLEQIIEALGQHPLLSWKSIFNTVQPKILPKENTPVTKLAHSDNKLVNKIVITFSSVALEIDNLINEANSKLYQPLLLYGESDSFLESTGDAQLCLSRILPTLHLTNCFIKRVGKVLQHVLLQLGAFYSSDKKAQLMYHAEEVNLQVVFERIGGLLATLITIDEIITNNLLLHDHWGAYRRMIKSTLASAQNEERKKLKSIERLLNDIENAVMQGNAFKSTLVKCRDSTDIRQVKTSSLSSRMLIVLTGWCSQLEQSTADGWWSDCQEQLIALTTLLILHNQIFNTVEKKLVKTLLSAYKKVPCLTLYGPVVWFGEIHLPKYAPAYETIIDRKTQETLLSHRANFLSQKVSSLPKDIQNHNLQVCGWSVQLHEAAKTSTSQLSNHDLVQRASLLLQGLLIASTIKYTIESILNLHTALGHPMGKACVVNLGLLVETLKSLERTYDHHNLLLAESLPHVTQFISYQILNIVANAKKRLYNDRHLDEKKLDIICALFLVEQSLSGPGTKERRLLARVALSYAKQSKTFTDEDLSTLLVLLRRYDLAVEVQNKLNEVTNCSLLYHHRVILTSFIEKFTQSPTAFQHTHLILNAIEDCSDELKSAKHITYGKLLEDYQNDIQEKFETIVLNKLCKEVETELRLSTHLHLKLDDRNPFNNPLSATISPLISLHNVQIFDVSLSVKEFIEQYLERTFYSLTVVAPHDCHSYDQMRSVATHKYKLEPLPSNLPSHTLEQTVDVLEIMRNIDVFVQSYLYNLNQQFFVEKTSKNKHLNTISIKHIANSIRTHGAGIINTTVNYTYQFLRKKFQIFSQFLYDEHIKSRLLKDLQHWKSVKGTESSFPYDRALKFHRGIRKLGLNNDGLSYLDQFRKLVSQIGNAMGYIRLVRSSGLDCSSTSTLFIPDLEDIFNFSEVCESLDISSETKNAAKNLDAVITNLTDNFQQGTDYFKMMVDVFAGVLQNQKNSHLKNFYLIIPPLTINFIENSLTSKENLLKKSKSDIAFTDDGLAMGIAYLLKVLGQEDAFNSLHWWTTIRKKFSEQKEKIKKQNEIGVGSDDKLQQTLALTLSRLKSNQREFELLYLSMSSAQVFFK